MPVEIGTVYRRLGGGCFVLGGFYVCGYVCMLRLEDRIRSLPA